MKSIFSYLNTSRLKLSTSVPVSAPLFSNSSRLFSTTNLPIPTNVEEWMKSKSSLLQSVEEYTIRDIKRLASILNKPFEKNSWFFNELRGSHPASHWLFNQPNFMTSDLDKDGFMNTFSPPAPFSVRMWVGGEIKYHLHSPFIGEEVSTFTFMPTMPVVKHSKTQGLLLFTTVETLYFSKSSSQLLMTELTNYVYKQDTKSVVETSVDNQEKKQEQEHDQTNKKQSNNSINNSNNNNLLFSDLVTVPLDEVTLFRYSALTWNAHKIHYDKEYAKSERHENILVHGPLQATLLLDNIEKLSRLIAPPEPEIEKRKIRYLMAEYTKAETMDAIKHMDDDDPIKTDALQQLYNFNDQDIDLTLAPPYHLRHQKLSMFSYKCKKPLPVNTKIKINAQLIHDQDISRINQLNSMADDKIENKDLLSHTYWLRTNPATAKIWISDVDDINNIYTEATVVFTSHESGFENIDPTKLQPFELDPNQYPFMKIDHDE